MSNQDWQKKEFERWEKQLTHVPELSLQAKGPKFKSGVGRGDVIKDTDGKEWLITGIIIEEYKKDVIPLSEFQGHFSVPKRARDLNDSNTD